MKVGILTLPLWNNYGGMLQAYALRVALNRLGMDAVHIDVQRVRASRTTQTLSDIKRFVRTRLLRKTSPYYPNTAERDFISKQTRSFVESDILPSTGPLTFGDLPSTSRQFDAIVVGSDQVWRPEYAPELDAYFLEFAGGNIRKVAYAASFGTDDWRFDENQTLRIAKALRCFQAISVRESSAVDLLRDKVGAASEQMCDPTMLLEAKHYQARAKEAEFSGQEGVLAYVLDPSEPRMRGLPRIAERLSMPLFTIMPHPFDRAFASSPGDYVFPPVDRWLASFEASRFVVTDSFHGCVFSIIFNKPFIAVVNTERGRARFDSLLDTFGLSDLLVEDSSQVTAEMLKRPIDWTHANQVRRSLRERGNAYLSQSLLGVPV